MQTRSMIMALIATVMSATVFGDDNWPQFRGHGGLGIGSGNPPTEWDIQTEQNVAWKTPIPGLGHSAPIVWGDRVFLTTAINSETDAPELEWGFASSPIISDGHVIVQCDCLNANFVAILMCPLLSG